jgi:hypothetical protein
MQNFYYWRRITIVPSVRLDSKWSVGTILNCTTFSTDDVCNGNRRSLNSRYTEDCHFQSYKNMCHGAHTGFTALHTALHRVLEDSLLRCFFTRNGCNLVHNHHYVSKSVQSCDASKPLLQGEKQQQFYVGEVS